MVEANNRKAIGAWINKLVGENVFIVEYVRDRGHLRNFWKLDTVSDIERNYQILLDMLDHPDQHWISTGSEEFITRIRLGIAKGEMQPGRVVFKYEDNLMFPNEYGVLDQWPKGFCDYNMDLSEELMMTAIEKRRAKREAKSWVE